ncbi:hypothetical protein AVEN_211461-1 [Araneus ventricosus]|uniref:Uncharacterized protein n=1 Tax=Araneus ventricosus TaxID=182803 RepID=A0A4Y2LVP3_ARAVE|nr:hypothetical protein AVEN_211461-1 [Araneus ventricosus]
MPRKNRQLQKTDQEETQDFPIFTPRRRSNSASSSISATPSVTSIDNTCYEEASTRDLFEKLRALINGGTTSTNSEGQTRYRAYLKMDLQIKANKMVDAIEFNYYQHPNNPKETAEIGCNTSAETKNMETIASTKNQETQVPEAPAVHNQTPLHLQATITAPIQHVQESTFASLCLKRT